MPPLCETTAIPRARLPSGRSPFSTCTTAGLNVAASGIRLLRNPSALGPRTAMSNSRAMSAITRWRAAPASPPLLAESGADDDRGLHPRLPARAQDSGDVLGRDGDDREVHRSRQRLHRGVAGDAGDLLVAAAHGVERSVEPVQGHRLHDSAADEGLVGGRADECDGARTEQGIEVGHGSGVAASGHRSPSPRATMPRRISRVPPWMVSLGAMRVA